MLDHRNDLPPRRGAWTLGAIVGGLIFYVALAAIFLTLELV